MIKLPPPLQIARIVGKASFFFWLSIFAIEAFLDINPTQVTVTHTSFSISYFEYITLFDLVHYFAAGLVILGMGAVLFAFSKYRFLPIILTAFVLAFYFDIVNSAQLMEYYKSTYACHFSSNPSDLYGYICPLEGMVNGRLNIPLQGNVLALISFAIASASFALSRLYRGMKIALLDTIILGTGVICIFEAGIYFWQSAWYLSHVTRYQGLIYLESLTNQELLGISSVVFCIAIGIRMWWAYQGKKRRDQALNSTPMIEPDKRKT